MTPRPRAPAELRAPTRMDWLASSCLAASAACDAVAVFVLLAGTRFPTAYECAAVVTAHGLAVLLVWSAECTRASRRWLNLAAVAAIPCLGAAVAATALTTRGRGASAPARRAAERPMPAFEQQEICRLADALSTYDALRCGDAEERLAALASLSRRSDAEAMALLRWTAADHDPDRALSAALVLDKLGERAERERSRSEPEEDERVFG